MRSNKYVTWLKLRLMVTFGVMTKKDWPPRKAQLCNLIARHTIKTIGKRPKIAIFYPRLSTFHPIQLPNFGLKKKVWYKTHFFAARYVGLIFINFYMFVTFLSKYVAVSNFISDFVS